jgi:hypothetical protein
MNQRSVVINSFKQSLFESLYSILGLLPERRVKRFTFTCEAPLEILKPERMEPPETLELFMDFEFELGEVSRLLMLLTYRTISKNCDGQPVAVYDAVCY